ncbi:MAG: CsoS2 family carboxysome shell protein [Sulfuricaulis sp.]
MQQSTNEMKATAGRAASMERRARLGQGKAALPSAHERSRTAGPGDTSQPTAAPVVVTPRATAPKAIAAPAPTPVSASYDAPQRSTLVGREASIARRIALGQGKAAVQQMQSATTTYSSASEPSMAAPSVSGFAADGRRVSQAMRAARTQGRGNAEPLRPSGRVREPKPIKYPLKVADTTTYAGQKVTGVRIGRGKSMTGDESGANMPVSGTQYIGTETGYAPRGGGVKVGAARTIAGLTVTGTQVRSGVMITGDESNASLRITGTADQELADDLIQHEAAGASGAQFKRMHDPHGMSVFGGNLGRSAKSVGSRERSRERAIEQSNDGLPITGTAVGRSSLVTGDEPGACRILTGSQYLKPANRQALCETDRGSRGNARGAASMGMNGRTDPVTGEKVSLSETWGRQRISGVAVEHNTKVTGAEFGVCTSITGTPYVGPGEFETYCTPEDAAAVAQRVAPGMNTGTRITGNITANLDQVTGTQRGGDRSITGTAYYRQDVDVGITDNPVEHINSRFSVRSPQRDAQLREDRSVIEAPTAHSRITGTFSAGVGKITGNQEFSFTPRSQAARGGDTSRITGEGRMEGPAITGGAWGLKKNVTGTEGHIAAERNPSHRAGESHAFANAYLFKGKGNYTQTTERVTGSNGWASKNASRVTLSGGAQG